MFVDDFSKVMQQENVHLDVIYVPSWGGGHVCALRCRSLEEVMNCFFYSLKINTFFHSARYLKLV